MPSFNLNPEQLMPDVYSYPFPEVRDLLGRLSLSPDFMLNTLPADKAQTLLSSYAFEPTLELTTHSDESLDLDELHVPVIDRMRSRMANQLKGIEGFDYAYPTPGSSQAMFTLMSEWHANGSMDSLAMLDGDYEGYAAYADSLHIPVKRYMELTDAPVEPKTVWFLSNPNAVDGNWLKSDEYHEFIGRGHEVVIDTAYADLTDDGSVDIAAPNIRAVLTSPSKIFGVFRYRNTGLAYCREPVKALYGSKWFKDVPALLDTLKLYETFKPHQLARAYRPVQAVLAAHLSKLVQCAVTPSDVLLLARSSGPLPAEYQRFRRRDGYRFGLTKLFEDYERSQPKGEK